MTAINEVVKEFLPLLKSMARGKYAISIAGSVGKNVHDEKSDIDFRLFYEEKADSEEFKRLRAEFIKKAKQFTQKGVKVDDLWPRSISEVDTLLDEWFSGNGNTIDFVWTVWGYHPLTDIQNQYVIEDEYGIISGWHKRLSDYPLKLKEKIVNENIASVDYWRGDYHFKSKMERGDAVFLCGLTSKIMHQLILILYAVNEKYYVGDGNNLRFMKDFEIKPEGFEKRAKEILYPGTGEDMYEKQYYELCRLIDEVKQMAGRE